MNDAVDRFLVEREAMDRGFPGSLVLSLFGHALLAGAAVAVPLLFPHEPPLKVATIFAVPLPPGGGGAPSLEPPAPAPAQPQPAPSEAPKAEPPPKVQKPPKEAPKPRGLPEPDAKRARGKPQKESPQPMRAGGAAGSTGASAKTPGLEFGPAGPGVPGGTDPFGDWYLASVQQKIWVIWNQQIKSGFTQPITVTFTILADGSLVDVKITESSGATLLDLAAQRAVYSAGPFGPLPKDYGTNRFTIQAVFKPLQ